jgi:N-acetylglucosaminyl-diphospho-decaprenol L-rhamnosyltransferase
VTPEISIIIVTWNSAGSISRCLTSLRDNAPTLPYEVILIDNASSDATVEVARSAFPGLVTIVNDSNRGLAAANNQGMRTARGRYFVISNPDVLYRAGTIDALVDVAERRPRAGFVITKLFYESGELQTSVGDMPTLREALLGRWALRRLSAAGEKSGFWWDGWAHDAEVAVGHGMECCYLVRRAVVDEVGLQDERFRLDWEGPDWSRRLHAAGWEIWFAPTAEAVHLGGLSIKQALPRWVSSSHRGMYMYFSAGTPLLLRPALAMALAARAAVKLLALRRDRLYTAGFEPR